MSLMPRRLNSSKEEQIGNVGCDGGFEGRDGAGATVGTDAGCSSSGRVVSSAASAIPWRDDGG
jgi:hypothetical protein